MFLFSNFLMATAEVVGMVLWLLTWIVIARAILSWVNPDPYNPIVRFLYGLTEPLLDRVRRLVPAYAGGIDFSPIVLLLAIYFLQVFLVQSLRDLAMTLR